MKGLQGEEACLSGGSFEGLLEHSVHDSCMAHILIVRDRIASILHIQATEDSRYNGGSALASRLRVVDISLWPLGSDDQPRARLGDQFTLFPTGSVKDVPSVVVVVL